MVACKPINGSGLPHLLAPVAFLEQAWEQLQQEIEQRLLPFQEGIRLLMSMPGMAELSAAGMLAEIGTARSRFPSAKHASVLGRSLSWA
jgi:transposase